MRTRNQKLYSGLFLSLLLMFSGCGGTGGGGNTGGPGPTQPPVTPLPIDGVNLYYVSSTSTSTDWSVALNIATPCTVDTAMTNAKAGDTVYFLAGTYQTAWRSHEHANWEPKNSGTATAPITFAAYPGAQVIINGQLASGTTSDNESPDMIRVFSTGDMNYITFDGFTIQANNGQKIGGIIIGHGLLNNNYIQGCKVLNCIFKGGTTIIQCNTNRECIRIEGTTDTLVKNCRVESPQHQSNNMNTTAIKMYYTRNTTIENCEIIGGSIGIFDKSHSNNSTFRYNYIHDCQVGIHLNGYGDAPSSNHTNTKIYHNVIAFSKNISINDVTQEESCSDGLEISNNTFYTGNTIGVSVNIGTGLSKKVYDNIFYGLRTNGDVGLLRFYESDNSQANPLTLIECDHNQFGDLPNNFLIRTHKRNGPYVSYNSLAQWQNSTFLANGGHPEEGSLVSNPKFRNVTGNMSRLDDFQLGSDSPCLGAGRNGGDMGADISRVGVIQ